MKILFASDLDNTLLFSYKHRMENDICTEILAEKEQGFMTPYTIEKLKEVCENTIFCAVTTRSIEQFERIQWRDGSAPRYAAVSNGGNLLCDGIPDMQWNRSSQQQVDSYRKELLDLQEQLSKDPEFIRCRIVDDTYLFMYCAPSVDPKTKAAQMQEITSMQVALSGKKIYFFPEGIDKGNTIKRLREMLQPDVVIAAGDSIIDVPMLNEADYALVPDKEMASVLKCGNIMITPDGERFSDFIMDFVLGKV